MLFSYGIWKIRCFTCFWYNFDRLYKTLGEVQQYLNMILFAPFKGVYRNKSRERQTLWTVNSKQLASWKSGISIRYFKGTQTVQSPCKYYFISPSNKTSRKKTSFLKKQCTSSFQRSNNWVLHTNEKEINGTTSNIKGLH